MMTINDEQRATIAAKLDGMTLPAGLGNEHSACSIAAINLALTGKLTDEIPDCMSEVIGEWIIVVQDSMPDEMRNSRQWKALLPLAAGTGRDRERERQRVALILEWMWETALPIVQPLADDLGFGPQWQRMTDERSVDAARTAAAMAAANTAADALNVAEWAVNVAEWAANAAARVAWAANVATNAAADAVRAMAATNAAADAVRAKAATNAIRAAAVAADAWQAFDPCDLLERLIDEGSAE